MSRPPSPVSPVPSAAEIEDARRAEEVAAQAAAEIEAKRREASDDDAGDWEAAAEDVDDEKLAAVSRMGAARREKLQQGFSALQQHMEADQAKDKARDIVRSKFRHLIFEMNKRQAFREYMHEADPAALAKLRERHHARSLESGHTDGCVDFNEEQLRADFMHRFNAWATDPANLVTLSRIAHESAKYYAHNRMPGSGMELPFVGKVMGDNRVTEVDAALAKMPTNGVLETIAALLSAPGHGWANSAGWQYTSGARDPASFNTILMSGLLQQFANEHAIQLLTGRLDMVGGVEFQVASAVQGVNFKGDVGLAHALFSMSPFAGAVKSAPAEEKAADRYEGSLSDDEARRYLEANLRFVGERLCQWVTDPRNRDDVSSVMSECYGIYQKRVVSAGTRLDEVGKLWAHCRATKSPPSTWPGLLMRRGSWKGDGHLLEALSSVGLDFEVGSASLNTLIMDRLFKACLRDVAIEMSVGLKPGDEARYMQDAEMWLHLGTRPRLIQSMAKNIYHASGFEALAGAGFAGVASQGTQLGADEEAAAVAAAELAPRM